jgi:hypothetical protein
MAMVFPTSPTVGQVFTGAGRSWVWNGSAWDAPSATNVLQVPIGLSHISTQTFTGVTEFSFPTNSFTSAFDAYQIVFVHESSSVDTNPLFRLRQTGTNDSTNNYVNQVFQAFGTGSQADAGTDAQVSLYVGSRTSGLINLTIANPNKALRTGIITTSSAYFGGGSTSTNLRLNYSTFQTNKVFDSCSFISGSGNFTGYASLYGYRK